MLELLAWVAGGIVVGLLAVRIEAATFAAGYVRGYRDGQQCVPPTYDETDAKPILRRR